jgi:Xaa-Pro aminopeptidase
MLEDLCKKYGSEKPSFDTIVLFGPNSALPHGRPSDRKLKKGDWILFDFGCTVRGFCSDMTRTIVFGKAGDRQKQIYSIVLAAQGKAKQKIRPGIQACEIDMYARTVIDKAGYGDTFGHATGHGVGLQIHESPRLFKNNTTTLVPDMVVTVEPGIYISGFGGVRIEDMVVVTKKGYRSLTRTPRTLLECT